MVVNTEIRHVRRSCILALFIALTIIIALMYAPLAYADNEEIGQNDCQIVSGNGTQDAPYQYHIGSGARVAWKHLASLNDTNTVDRYERYFKDGSLDYAWIFTGGAIKNPSGPYWLEISRYGGAPGTSTLPGGASAYYISTGNKTDFGGTARVILNVSNVWNDGQQLALFYYGGMSDAVVHGAGNPIDPQEYMTLDQICAGPDNLTVTDGCVEFSLSFGGNYFLIPTDVSTSITCTALKPDLATTGIPGASTAQISAVTSTAQTSASGESSTTSSNLSGWQIGGIVIVGLVIFGTGALVIVRRGRTR